MSRYIVTEEEAQFIAKHMGIFTGRELVECRDCKDYRRWIDTDAEFCAMTECRTTAHDFCSWGKRREDAETD